MFDKCTYNMDDVANSGKEIAAIIKDEIDDDIEPENIFLSGFSHGGQMVWNVAFGQLDYKIGGYFSIISTPFYPVWQTVEESEFTYTNSDMDWFVLSGADDQVYSPIDGQNEYKAVFNDIGIADALKYELILEGRAHQVDCRFIGILMRFVRDGTVTKIGDHNENCKIDIEFEEGTEIEPEEK